jgi:hypothetical protein
MNSAYGSGSGGSPTGGTVYRQLFDVRSGKQT